jgi:hypothetical protein
MNTEVLALIEGKRVCRYSSYRDTDPTDLGRLSYGDLKPLEKHQTPEDTDFFTSDYLSGSDYCSSGSVEVSNHRVFLEKYGELPNVHDVYGGYGTFAVAVRLDSITPEMLEDFAALENYPVLNDEDHSEVEMEAENEAWENCYRSDFTRELSKAFPEHEDTIASWSNEQVDTLFYALMERTNTYWEHESGNNAYVHLERVIKGATEQDWCIAMQRLYKTKMEAAL